jgi:hypothetical protein
MKIIATIATANRLLTVFDFDKNLHNSNAIIQFSGAMQMLTIVETSLCISITSLKSDYIRKVNVATFLFRR